MMKTMCAEADIRNYSFGLVCVDNVGAPVRHVFGKGSFDPVETFDTLIPCAQCLGLEDIPDDIAMNSQVLALQQEVNGLAQMMVTISQDVDKLSRAAFRGGRPQPAAIASGPLHLQPGGLRRAPLRVWPPAPAPAAVPVAAPIASPAPAAEAVASPIPAVALLTVEEATEGAEEQDQGQEEEEEEDSGLVEDAAQDGAEGGYGAPAD